MARDIAGRFNHRYRELFVLPEAVVDEDIALLTGLDGRKMSKSYGNTIALFEEEKALRKQIMKIVTNSQEPGEPKNPDESTIFEIYRAFADEAEQAEMRARYAAGIGWGEAKQALFERINAELSEPRERFRELTAHPARDQKTILQAGAAKARKHDASVPGRNPRRYRYPQAGLKRFGAGNTAPCRWKWQTYNKTAWLSLF